MLYWIIEKYHENMEEREMETKLEVSYVYDPVGKTLECNVEYNGAKDSFCVMYDETLTCKTIHEFINGFIQYLQEKQGGRK
jgi:hypothetical protein